MPILLAVDDDPMILRLFAALFPPPDVTLLTAWHRHRWTAAGTRVPARRRDPRIRLPDQSGLEAFRRIRELDARSPSSSSPGTGPPTPPSRR